jgi:hypothetical protein
MHSKHDAIALLLSPTTMAFLVVLATLPMIKEVLTFLLIGTVFLVILPTAPVVIMSLAGRVDLMVVERKRRTPFLIFSSISYLLSLISFFTVKCRVGMMIAASYLIVSTSILILNRFTKVSIHLAGASSSWAVLTLLGSRFSLLILPSLPLIAWSRYRIKAHTQCQILIGLFLGALEPLFLTIFLL